MQIDSLANKGEEVNQKVDAHEQRYQTKCGLEQLLILASSFPETFANASSLAHTYFYHFIQYFNVLPLELTEFSI